MELLVAYASMSGNSEFLAGEVGRALSAEPVHCDALTVDALAGRAVFVIPSWGDGEVPADAEPLLAALEGARLELSFALVAPGDSSYPSYCGGGKRFAAALRDAGAREVSLLCLDGTPAERHVPELLEWLAALKWT